MNSDYDHDLAAWSGEQAQLLRAGRFSQLDIAHLAEEIEDLGKRERRALASRLAVLLGHLLKWQYQPDYPNRFPPTCPWSSEQTLTDYWPGAAAGEVPC